MHRAPDAYRYKWRGAILVDGYLIWARGYETKDATAFRDELRERPAPNIECPECPNDDVRIGEKTADGAKVQRWFDCPDCGCEAPQKSCTVINGESLSSLETIERFSPAVFEFLWCPVCGQEVFTRIPFEGVFCRNCNTQVELQGSRETRGYEEAVLACFDTTTTWNLHVDEKLRRDLPDGSARVKILGAPGAYEVDWWSPEPGENQEPVERGEFDDVEEPDEVLHLG